MDIEMSSQTNHLVEYLWLNWEKEKIHKNLAKTLSKGILKKIFLFWKKDIAIYRIGDIVILTFSGLIAVGLVYLAVLDVKKSKTHVNKALKYDIYVVAFKIAMDLRHKELR